MLRPTRTLLALLLVAFALVASACADTTGPRPGGTTCDVSNPNTCH